MKIFLSWSGTRSKEIAQFFGDWIQGVLQNTKPWISTANIESGAQWFNEISSNLADTDVGILFLTQENQDKPWIYFEAGALTKGKITSRAMPFLIDLKKADVKAPLGQLHLTEFNKEDVLALIKTIHEQPEYDNKMPERILERTFETHWPDLETEFKRIIVKKQSEPTAPKRSLDEKIDEILLSVRSYENRFSELETTTVRINRREDKDNRHYKHTFELNGDSPSNMLTIEKLILAYKPNVAIAYKTDDVTKKVVRVFVYALMQLEPLESNSIKVILRIPPQVPVTVTRENFEHPTATIRYNSPPASGDDEVKADPNVA